MDILTDKQNTAYNSFYESTHENEFLDRKTEILVGLSAAIAMNCQPCTNYYLLQAKKSGILKGEIKAVLAKVMAVSAGQKKLQTQEVLNEFKINLDGFE
jgi:alkylhydroperoxidase/carboxymuconolactone decarboxylase family protein YurZ